MQEYNLNMHCQSDDLEERWAQEMRNNRLTLAMTQIRSHFVFNILNTISAMCKSDPEKADSTVIRFARYLRANIDITHDDQLVSFQSVLDHLEDYVALEQIRFGDRIRYTTQVETEDFLLPELVVQPLVENAIKHGLRPKSGGGTVRLRAWEEDGFVRICVCDDGMGFDTALLDGENCGGIPNVRFRLRCMADGTLYVRSTPGEGTCATISIPCEQAGL